MSDIRTPTIHLNGSSAQRLLDGLEAADAAMLAALEALAAAGPNARDYYPQGPAAFGLADDQHRARLRAVTAVREEIRHIYAHVHRESRR